MQRLYSADTDLGCYLTLDTHLLNRVEDKDAEGGFHSVRRQNRLWGSAWVAHWVRSRPLSSTEPQRLLRYALMWGMPASTRTALSHSLMSWISHTFKWTLPIWGSLETAAWLVERGAWQKLSPLDTDYTSAVCKQSCCCCCLRNADVSRAHAGPKVSPAQAC